MTTTARKSLPRGRNALAPEVVAADQRERLLIAMGELVAEHGYADVRVSDLIARAGVAKPRFYELFESKVGCFLALIDLTYGEITAAAVAELDPAGTIEERIAQGLAGIISWVHAHEDRARLIFIEGPSAGREAIDRIADGRELLASFYIGLREEVRRRDPSAPSMSQARASAIVAAVSEAIAVDLRHRHAQSTAELTADLVEVVVLLATAR